MSDFFKTFSKQVAEYCKEIECPDYNLEKGKCGGQCQIADFAQWYYERGWVVNRVDNIDKINEEIRKFGACDNDIDKLSHEINKLKCANKNMLNVLENCHKALHEIIMSNPEYYDQDPLFQETVIEAKKIISEVKEDIDG